MNMALNVPPAIAKIAPDGNLTPRQKRQFLIQMALRRVKPGTGSAPEFMRERTAMHNWPDLREILEGIDWVIIGGVATRAYMPERMTKDLDILVRKSDGEAVIERLKKAGYKLVSRLAVEGYLMRSPQDVDVDILFGKYPWLDEALANPEKDTVGYPTIGLPYLIMLKLVANRGRDLSDLYILLGWAEDVQLNQIRKVVSRYMPEEKDDLESLIFIGQHEQKDSPDWNPTTQ
ncbi:MAG TPA: nucleotidyl transferase AbiEii/AbiGii toxin family protein [Anaerolineales bacterium]|nr:nucleotidyl transferase AbiEii/AbiGii toxin family protein [Anaerolineales bacterium]